MGNTFFNKAKDNTTMNNLTDHQASLILAVHDNLWDHLYAAKNQGFYAGNAQIKYKEHDYQINIPAHMGFASVLLPNANDRKYLWITQNLNKSSYGSLAIQRCASIGHDHRITWIVDTNDGGFVYRTNITTTYDSDGKIYFGSIEIYDSLGAENIWSHNKVLTKRKAAF
jgi:hypothetical protein